MLAPLQDGAAMRINLSIAACLLMTFATAASADHVAPSPAPTPERVPSPRVVRALPFFSFRSIAAQIDNQVVANLLAEPQARSNDLALSIHAGEITRCESQTCHVPLTIRVADAQGPVSLAFAVANSKGELSDVQHAECGNGTCMISLILERGRNVLSVGAVDGVSHSSGYTTLHVNANRSFAANGKTEWF
jgi:hypothetical protein